MYTTKKTGWIILGLMFVMALQLAFGAFASFASKEDPYARGFRILDAVEVAERWNQAGIHLTTEQRNAAYVSDYLRAGGFVSAQNQNLIGAQIGSWIGFPYPNPAELAKFLQEEGYVVETIRKNRDGAFVANIHIGDIIFVRVKNTRQHVAAICVGSEGGDAELLFLEKPAFLKASGRRVQWSQFQHSRTAEIELTVIHMSASARLWDVTESFLNYRVSLQSAGLYLAEHSDCTIRVTAEPTLTADVLYLVKESKNRKGVGLLANGGAFLTANPNGGVITADVCTLEPSKSQLFRILQSDESTYFLLSLSSGKFVQVNYVGKERRLEAAGNHPREWERFYINVPKWGPLYGDLYSDDGIIYPVGSTELTDPLPESDFPQIHFLTPDPDAPRQDPDWVTDDTPIEGTVDDND